MSDCFSIQILCHRTATHSALSFCLLLWLVYVPRLVFSQEDETVEREIRLTNSQHNFFETRIRPLLVEKCLSCHGEAKQEGGLRLDTREAMLVGGDSGAAVSVGLPEISLIVEAIEYQSLQMPPSGQLSKKEISALRKWISAGASWPEQKPLRSAKNLTDEDHNWWCIQPLRQPAVPETDDQGWCKNEIDHFVFRKLVEQQLQPTPQADFSTLRRRLAFAVTGLPPDPELIDSVDIATRFSPSKLIDKLLASDAYGENQARYWLDLVRYADSDGYRADHKRPHASEYRDYVIRSFQTDKPFDQFVVEQIAGDETDPSNRDAIVATMYLRHWIYEHNQRDVEGQWQQILDDITETTADTFLALGLKCARCHDHKFDPLLQNDYYRLKAFFTPLLPRDDQPVATPEQHVDYRKQLELWEKETQSVRMQLRDLQLPELLKHATREGFDKFVSEIKAMVLKPANQRSPYEHQIAIMAERQFDLEPEKLPLWLDAEVEARRQQLLAELAEFDHLKPKPLPVQAFVISDVGEESPPTTIVGDSAGKSIQPGFPTLLDPAPAIVVPLPELQSTGRRTALANWIADDRNPLTARVIVNRIWQQHFGRGLVENASDFGHLTPPPSHPELLDWLAAELINDDWSLKSLHRRILNSATYQQSSKRKTSKRLSERDPANLLLWKMNSRRLSAEEISDSILWASGQLEKEQRTIYQPVLRNAIHPRLSLFDFPDRITGTGKRHLTTTPTQALTLMNNPWMQQQAEIIESKYQDLTDDDLLPTLYLKLFARRPNDSELAAALDFVREYTNSLRPIPTASDASTPQPRSTRRSAPKRPAPDRQARQALILALLNSNEMIYVD